MIKALISFLITLLGVIVICKFFRFSIKQMAKSMFFVTVAFAILGAIVIVF